MTEDWSPEKEKDDDPGRLVRESVELQKEQLQVGKELLRKAKEEEDRKKAIEGKIEERLEREAPALVGMPVYKPPSLEQISARCKKIWEEVKRIVPDAPELVKVTVFQTLLSSADDDPA